MADNVNTGIEQASRKRPVLLCMLVVSVLLLANSRALVAELFSMPGRALLQRQDVAQWRMRDTVFANGQRLANQAVALQASNPEYHVLVARLGLERCKYWDVMSQWDARRTCFRSARDALRHALSGNPLSAATWSNLLLAKFWLEEFDEEFFRAVDQVTRLAPYDYAINKLVAFIGMQGWPRWTDARRTQFAIPIRRVHQISPREAKKLADAAGRGLLYCLMTEGDRRQHISCRQGTAHRKTETPIAAPAPWD